MSPLRRPASVGDPHGPTGFGRPDQNRCDHCHGAVVAEASIVAPGRARSSRFW